jgi:site-specific recombinase XerD
MVKRGTNLRIVQEAMGRKDLDATSLYVGLEREQMNKEMQENARP